MLSPRTPLLLLLAFLLPGCAALMGTAKERRPSPSQMTDAPGDVWQHAIASSGNTVHFVWGTTKIFYRRSEDEGLTWSDDIVLSSDGEVHLTDPIASSGDDVSVIFLRDQYQVRDWCCPRTVGDVYITRSMDGGRTWQPVRRLTHGAAAFRVSTAITGSRLDVVWSDFRSGTWQLYYVRSLDGGESWEAERLLVKSGATETNRPQIATDGETIHVVWIDDRDKNEPCYTTPHCPEVYYIRSTTGGDTWDPPRRLTFDQPFSSRPDIAAFSRMVFVSYDEDDDNNRSHEQHLLRSRDNGDTWERSIRLSRAPGASDHGSLIASNGVLHLAWHDARDPSNLDIYYRSSSDSGLTWSPEENISQASGMSSTPLLAATTQCLHAIWLDDRTGVVQVWYHRRCL